MVRVDQQDDRAANYVTRAGNMSPGLRWRRAVGEEKWLGDVDSNHDKQSQSLLSYR